MAVVKTELRRALCSEIESPTAKLVYLSLVHEGRATVAELQERLGEPRITLYGVLEALAERELVDEESAGRRTVYAPRT